ncbi:MAG TPA: GGDEF domain-containing protein [Geobacteraceae bacterium]|nr:GGDEF domain-containing protein [Geobacteraceae bacterium]
MPESRYGRLCFEAFEVGRALCGNLIDAREALRKKAAHDPLTGLWNHEEVFRILEEEQQRVRRRGGHVSVDMADLDYFKRVNDTYGHLAGDAVLRLTAERLRSMMRKYDAIGRYGGEEFLIVLPECDTENASAIAERLRLGIPEQQSQSDYEKSLWL